MQGMPVYTSEPNNSDQVAFLKAAITQPYTDNLNPATGLMR